MTNLLGEPPETLLPTDTGAEALDEGRDVQNVAAAHPDSTLAWALLAEAALDEGRDLEGYAFARTSYHRSLDMLRRNGWKGHGPVPWSHAPNRGIPALSGGTRHRLGTSRRRTGGAALP